MRWLGSAERLAFSKPGSSRHQLELRLECDQEASRFATGDDAMGTDFTISI